MKDYIEAGICKNAQITHVALHAGQRKAFALRHMTVLCKLPGRGIEHGDLRARRRKNGSLLAASTCKAEDAQAAHIIQPARWQGAGREPRLPASGTGSGYFSAVDRARPVAVFRCLQVPGSGVVGKDVDGFCHGTLS